MYIINIDFFTSLLLENFDHHCPWISNCVGSFNYRQFFVFVFALNLADFMLLATMIFSTFHKEDPLLRVYLHNLPNFVPLFLIPYGFFFGLLLSVLSSYHCFLIVSGRTTNEHIKAYSISLSEDSHEKVLYNIKSFLLGRKNKRYQILVNYFLSILF